ncbi:MAG TPA: hypothetical protein VF077_06600 [Nitrospiraceae bacterium]
MADTVITRGSKEYFFVDMTDFLNTISDLSGSSPTFTVKDSSNNVLINNLAVANVSETVPGNGKFMRLWCLIDTTVGGPTAGLWDAGAYRLYAKMTIGSEVPVVGPLALSVDGS